MTKLDLAACLSSAPLFVAIAVPSQADIRSDVAMTTGVFANSTQRPKAAVAFTTFIKGDTEREEMTVSSPIAVKLAVLLLPDQDKFTYIDPNLKICSICPLSEAPPDLMGLANVQNLLQFNRVDAASKTGTLTTYVTVKDLGVDVAPDAKRSGHHYTIQTHRVTTGAAGTSDSTSYSDIWIDPSLKRPDLKLLRGTPRTYVLPTGAKITYRVVGDAEALNSLSGYLPIEMQVRTGKQSAPLFTFTQTAVATEPLAADLFSIPTTYKQMTLPEFVQAETDSILDAIAGPQPKLPPKK